MQVRDAQVNKLVADHPGTLNTLNSLALAYQAAGRLPEAIALFEQVRDARVKKRGADHPDTLGSLHSLAGAYQAAGKLPEAIALFEQVRDAQVKTQGADHPDTLWTMYVLAWAYQAAGKVPEAIPLYEQAAAGIEKRRFQHKNAGDIILNTARAYEQAKQFDKGEAWRRKWLAAVKERAGADSPEYANLLSAPGSEPAPPKEVDRGGDGPEGEPGHLREDAARRLADVQHQVDTRRALLGQKKYADAEPLLLAGYEGLKQREKTIPPQSRPNLTQAVERLVQLYDAMARKDEAAKWRKELAGRKGPPKEP